MINAENVWRRAGLFMVRLLSRVGEVPGRSSRNARRLGALLLEETATDVGSGHARRFFSMARTQCVGGRWCAAMRSVVVAKAVRPGQLRRLPGSAACCGIDLLRRESSAGRQPARRQ